MKNEIEDFELIRQSIFWMQVCSNMTQEETIKQANNIYSATGVYEWEMAPSTICPDPNPNTCDESPDHKHYLLVMKGMFEGGENETKTVSSSGTVKE